MKSPAAIIDQHPAAESRRRVRLVLLSACLIAAQWFAVLHALEHNLHLKSGHTEHVCFTCVTADHLGDGFIALTITISGVVVSETCVAYHPVGLSIESTHAYFARAPPNCSLS